MARVNLHIPLRLTEQKVFFTASPHPEPLLFGYPAKFKADKGYFYLELTNLPGGKAAAILERTRRCLKWASVRLDIGMRIDPQPLMRAVASTFDGQFAIAYPAGTNPNVVRIEAKGQTQEPSTRLFAALQEAAARKGFLCGTLALACELYAAAEFEATANAQFLMFTSVLEVLAKPARRHARCVRLVEKLLEEAKKAQERAATTGNEEVAESFKALQDSAKFLKSESINSSVRRLAIATSRALGDSDPQGAGKRATTLYRKRSKLVHEGLEVSWADVRELRTFVREALAVRAGCYDRFRERHP